MTSFVRKAIGAGRRLRYVALAASLLAGAPANAAQPAQKLVLVLQSSDRGNLVLDNFTPNFHVELDQRVEQPVNFVQVIVTPAGPVSAPEQAVIDFIQSTFADGRKPDLIVAIAGPAAVFARKHRKQLFPETPLLLAAVDERYLSGEPPGENEIAVAVLNDFPRILDETLQVLPETRQVFMIMGSGQIGRFWRRQLDEPFARFSGRVTFVWLDDLSLQDLLRRSASLPANSVLYYFAFGTDAAGSAYADERVLADLHAAANAPLLGAHSVYLGAGIVGGSLMVIDDLSRRSADVATQLLNGTPPNRIKVAPQRPGQPVFDWRELQRWGIPESRLPPGSAVRYRAPTLWQAYRGTVEIAAAVLAVQSLLIAGLLYQRRARQRAERDSRRNLSLAAAASRRETMSALTSSIGHELGQPLGSIMLNTEALQMMLAANQATTETIREAVLDIQAQGVHATQIIERHRAMLRSRQLDTQPIDLHAVIRETLALVAHDMNARKVEAAVNLFSARCAIVGDQVLLQQVFVNLVMNAMDAMAQTPEGARRLTVSTSARAADVEVSIRDTGPGLPPQILDKPFAPFVTTKSNGLGIGLTIVQSIVDAHRGAIVARNHPEGGAIFTVTLGRSEGVA